MSETPGKFKQFVFYALMILMTFGCIVGILELGLTIYFTDRQSTNFIQFHPVRGWALVPGRYSVKPLQRLTSFPIVINDLGLRGHDLLQRPQSRTRIVVLGDSFTFAKETPTERLFTRQLQELLDGRMRGVEVMNAGVPGYGTGQELLFMRELHEHGVDPNIYVLMFFTNDILDNLCLSYGNLTPQAIRPCFALDQDGQPVLRKPPEKRFENDDDTLVESRQGQGGGLKTPAVTRALAEEWLQTKPSLVALLARLGFKVQMARVPALLNGWYRDDIVANGAPLTRALIRRIQREAGERGARLLVSMVPSPLEVYPETYVPVLRRSFPDSPLVERFAADRSRSQRLVMEMCAEAGIPFQDLLPVFLEHNDRMLFFPRDGHLNDAGHALVGRSLFDFVVSQWPESEQ